MLNSVWIGVVELGLGVAGLLLGLLGRLNRASMLIAVGLVIIGGSKLIPGDKSWYLPDAGAVIVLLGIGMTMGMLRRSRRRGGPRNRR